LAGEDARQRRRKASAAIGLRSRGGCSQRRKGNARRWKMPEKGAREHVDHKVNLNATSEQELADLGLPKLPDVKDDFLKLCDRLGVRH
jgi:hypothetical protein